MLNVSMVPSSPCSSVFENSETLQCEGHQLSIFMHVSSGTVETVIFLLRKLEAVIHKIINQ